MRNVSLTVALLAALCLPFDLVAQITITNGPHVTDVAHSNGVSSADYDGDGEREQTRTLVLIR